MAKPTKSNVVQTNPEMTFPVHLSQVRKVALILAEQSLVAMAYHGSMAPNCASTNQLSPKELRIVPLTPQSPLI
jgi:hypothetical protein